MAAKPKPLADQVMVLTGASSAVGLCTAQLAAQAGARLVLVARSSNVLESLVGLIGDHGGEAISLAADVSVREEVLAAAQAAVGRFGRIDTWINNAGVCIYGRLDEVTEADSRHLFDINFWGVVNGSLAALPHLLRGGGSLINVGSEVPEGAMALQGMYSSSKHAVRGFTSALRAEIEEAHHAAVSIALIEPVAADMALRHGAGHAAWAPGMPASVVDPMQVAEAILAAASEGARAVGLAQSGARTVRPGAAAMLPAARPSAKHA
jgi:NADP-dependent 3-hydroxy acid dehydrogenase YdfG